MQKLFTRVKRKARRELRKLIRHNSYYRPDGFYESGSAYVARASQTGSKYTEVYPDYPISVSMPDEFYAVQSAAYVADDPSPTLPSTLVAKHTYATVAIPNGRLYSDNLTMTAIITPDNKILADVSYEVSQGKRLLDHQKHPLFKLKYFKKATHYPGIVFNTLSGGGCTDNFAHWLVDVLPMFHLFDKAGFVREECRVVVPAQALHYQRDSLQLLGIPKDKIIVGEEQTHIQADLLVASTFPRGMNSQLIPDWVTEFHRTNFLTESTTQNSPYPKRVYINRRDGNFRKVLNEDEVEKLLSKYGFESFKLSALPFPEMIRLFANAEAIVSPTGAGMTNLFYCKPNTPVLEICPGGHVHSFYLNIAQSAGLHYDYIICKSNQTSKNRTKEEVSNENLVVDLDMLERKVKGFLLGT